MTVIYVPSDHQIYKKKIRYCDFEMEVFITEHILSLCYSRTLTSLDEDNLRQCTCLCLFLMLPCTSYLVYPSLLACAWRTTAQLGAVLD